MSLIPSTLAITIGFNPETLTAINTLSAAIASASGAAAPAAAANTASANRASASSKSQDKPGVDEAGDIIYWGNHEKKVYGTVDSEDAFKALKKKDPKIVKLTQTQYDKKQGELAAAAAEKDPDEEREVPTEQDLIDAFGSFLNPDLDEDEKTERRAFVKPLVARFKAKKASEIPEEHRALALNLLARHVAGQDIDPKTAEFEEFDAEDALV